VLGAEVDSVADADGCDRARRVRQGTDVVVLRYAKYLNPHTLGLGIIRPRGHQFEEQFGVVPWLQGFALGSRRDEEGPRRFSVAEFSVCQAVVDSWIGHGDILYARRTRVDLQRSSDGARPESPRTERQSTHPRQ
jgi:hypothetical protein